MDRRWTAESNGSKLRAGTSDGCAEAAEGRGYARGPQPLALAGCALACGAMMRLGTRMAESGEGMTQKKRQDIEIVMLAEARAEVSQADNKASLVLTALGIGYAAVLGGLLAGDWTPLQLCGAGRATWWLGAAAATAAVGAAAASVWPRYRRSDASEGVRYWGHVAGYSTLRAFAAALDSAPVDPTERTRHQLWHLSRLVARKYLLVRIAMALSLASVPLFAAAIPLGQCGG